jgi:SAM-dependent methyltransferase
LSNGLESLRQIPTASVDDVWSHVVLQHVRLCEFDDLLRETRRILTPTGACAHKVDLQDIVAKSLNHLRFSEAFWEESRIVTETGYYTNRIRYEEILARFRAAGNSPTLCDINRWLRLPIERSQLDQAFNDLLDDDLSVIGFGGLLTPV